MNSINVQQTKMPAYEGSTNAVSAPPLYGVAKAVEPSVALDGVVVTISSKALKLQSLDQEYVSPQNGAGTLPPTEEAESDKTNELPDVVAPLNGGGTLPPEPVKGKP